MNSIEYEAVMIVLFINVFKNINKVTKESSYVKIIVEPFSNIRITFEDLSNAKTMGRLSNAFPSDFPKFLIKLCKIYKVLSYQLCITIIDID